MPIYEEQQLQQIYPLSRFKCRILNPRPWLAPTAGVPRNESIRTERRKGSMWVQLVESAKMAVKTEVRLTRR